jgi:hypothetical protein
MGDSSCQPIVRHINLLIVEIRLLQNWTAQKYSARSDAREHDGHRAKPQLTPHNDKPSSRPTDVDQVREPLKRTLRRAARPPLILQQSNIQMWSG